IKACHLVSADSSLLTIRSREEQSFVENLLYRMHQVVDGAWLGLKINPFNKQKWADNSDVGFTNWEAGKPSYSSDKVCVQLIPDDPNKGKWFDEPCTKKNLVVCQRSPTWTLSRLQQALLSM